MLPRKFLSIYILPIYERHIKGEETVKRPESVTVDGRKTVRGLPYIWRPHRMGRGSKRSKICGQAVPGWEWKRLKGCVFSPPFLLPVLGRPKEARKRSLSITSIPVCLQIFNGQRDRGVQNKCCGRLIWKPHYLDHSRRQQMLLLWARNLSQVDNRLAPTLLFTRTPEITPQSQI